MEEELLEIVRLAERAGLDTDVALFHIGGEWWAEAVNSVSAVSLGESTGLVYSGFFPTPSAAVHDLLEQMRNAK